MLVKNIRKLDPKAPPGAYRYVILDEAGRFKEEDHPDFRNRGWMYPPHQVVPDVRGM